MAATGQQHQPNSNANNVNQDEKEEPQNELMPLPLQLLSAKLPNDWKKQLESDNSELRKKVKRQAPTLLGGDKQACLDVLRLYVMSLYLSIDCT